MMINMHQLKKSYGNCIKKEFHNDEVPPEKPQCLTYSIILIDSVKNINKTLLSKRLQDECNFVAKINNKQKL